jgi:riboflavin synthase
MFTGIVEEAAEVIALQPVSSGACLKVSSDLDHAETGIGDSICIEGVCLTVVKKQQVGTSWELSFDLAQETVERSVLGSLKAAQRVNLERSLRAGARIHGHFVLGHVDSSVELLARESVGNSVRLLWQLPKAYRKFIAEKGSVTLAGISLTVGEVTEKDFAVYIIPHTGDVTTLLERKVGEMVNIEVDVLARYLLNAANIESEGASIGITQEFLKTHGFDGGAS